MSTNKPSIGSVVLEISSVIKKKIESILGNGNLTMYQIVVRCQQLIHR